MNRQSEKKSASRKPAGEGDRLRNEKIDRRTLVRRGVKAAYVVPAVLAAIKATENPVIAHSLADD